MKVIRETTAGTLPTPAILLSARTECDLLFIQEDDGVAWSWAAMARAAAAVARSLGNVSGQRVAVTARNDGIFIAALFGVWWAGGVPAPLSYRLPPAERAKVLSTLQPVRTVAAADLGLTADLQLTATELLAAPPVGELPVPRPPTADESIVLFTSGTTGLPKGIVHTTRSVWSFVDQVASRPVDPDQLAAPAEGPPRRVEPKPLVHVAGIYGLLFDMWRGRGLVLMQSFQPARFAELLREFDIPVAGVTPTMMRMLLDARDTIGAISPPVRVATTGTAPTPDVLREEFEQAFGVPVQTTYGQTEAGGAISFEPLEDVLAGRRRPGSSGRLASGVELDVRDADGASLPPLQSGELWVRSAGVSAQVLGDDKPRIVDGWLDTGDLGHLDEDGYVYVTGRRRELIIRGGLKIAPAEVEVALLDHPAVIECAVAGVPDRRLGEVPVAWIRLRAEVDDEALTGFLRARLAAYKVPSVFQRVIEFPRTETGKVRKGDLLKAFSGSGAQP